MYYPDQLFCFSPIGNRKSSDCTGSGPSKLSADRQAIEYAPAYPMQWADLYTTWNLAFVTNSKSWPYAFTKLLIPSVSGYHHLDNSDYYESHSELKFQKKSIFVGQNTFFAISKLGKNPFLHQKKV